MKCHDAGHIACFNLAENGTICLTRNSGSGAGLVSHAIFPMCRDHDSNFGRCLVFVSLAAARAQEPSFPACGGSYCSGFMNVSQ